LKLKILRQLLAFKLLPRWKSREAFLKWQRKQLLAHQDFLYQNSPYYRDLIKQGYDIDTFPIIGKEEFMANFNQINTVGIDREEALELAIRCETENDIEPTINGYAVGLSTGTSGNRGMFVVSEDERAGWVAMVMHRVLKPTLFKRQRIAFILRANNKLYESVQSRLFDFLYLNLPDSLPPFIAQLNAYQPHVLTGQPSVLRVLAEEKIAGRLSILPQQILSYAEVLEPDDKTRIEQAFGIELTEVYQCTEGFLGVSCGGIMHMNEDIVRIEKEYVSEGRFRPIVTDFRRKSQPVVRYRMNDILVETDEFSPCGSPRMAISRIEGRMDEVIRLRHESGEWQSVYPDMIRRRIIMSQEGVQEYRVNQVADDQLHIHLLCSENTYKSSCEQVKKSLNIYFEERNLRLPELTFFDHIPPSNAIKRRRIIRTVSSS